MIGDPPADIGDLIRGLLQSVPLESVADFGTFDHAFPPLRPTPVGKSKFKQNPDDIDRALIDDRKARATARSKPAHAEPGAGPGRKRKTVGPPTQSTSPSGSPNLTEAFSIAGAKARKHWQKLERFGPAEPRGMHRRRPKKRVPTS